MCISNWCQNLSRLFFVYLRVISICIWLFSSNCLRVINNMWPFTNLSHRSMYIAIQVISSKLTSVCVCSHSPFFVLSGISVCVFLLAEYQHNPPEVNNYVINMRTFLKWCSISSSSKCIIISRQTDGWTNEWQPRMKTMTSPKESQQRLIWVNHHFLCHIYIYSLHYVQRQMQQANYSWAISYDFLVTYFCHSLIYPKVQRVSYSEGMAQHKILHWDIVIWDM